jgi:hypothetical protein
MPVSDADFEAIILSSNAILSIPDSKERESCVAESEPKSVSVMVRVSHAPASFPILSNRGRTHHLFQATAVGTIAHQLRQFILEFLPLGDVLTLPLVERSAADIVAPYFTRIRHKVRGDSPLDPFRASSP